MASIFDRMSAGATRLAHAWNAFIANDDNTPPQNFQSYGPSFSTRPDRRRLTYGNERSLLASILTRLGMDTAGYPIKHVRLDDTGQYVSDIQSGINNCLTVEANIDQAARAFRQDIVMTMFEKGVVAVVPVDTTLDPTITGSYDITTMRAGEITQWYTRQVRVKLWNDNLGRFEEIIVPKTNTAIIENPLYSVMNEPNSTLQRLIRKLNLLDSVDEASSSGQLDLIIQLPYVIKTEAKREQANSRMADIEAQLKGSKYGIAYTDGTEHITQLNRPAENNMLAQIQYLTTTLYGQLGLTEDIFTGAANEEEQVSYFNRTIEPVLTAITEAMARTFLTKTARSQNQSIAYFRDPFKLVTVADIADTADKLSRNEILTANEIRAILGFSPSSDPMASKLINSNMPQKYANAPTATTAAVPVTQPTDPQANSDSATQTSPPTDPNEPTTE